MFSSYRGLSMKGAFAQFLLVISLTSLVTLRSAAQSGIFTCKSPAMCRALVDYKAYENTTTLATLQALFGVKKHRTILGANNLPISTSPNYTLTEGQRIKIPFTCACRNNTGASYNQPIYTVQKDDGLYHIAANVFSGLVNDDMIGAANGIPDLDVIDEGAKFYIPLPCSCDDVDGVKVVHYGHLVEDGSTLEIIAQTYGTTEGVLMRLNNISDPVNGLFADHVLDVPLPACESSVRNDSLDSPLLVANGTYVFTANNCVKCKCDAANNWTLQCEPSQIDVNPSKWITCPSMQCSGTNMTIGNATTSSGCTQTCSYAGYNAQTIFTTLVNGTSCSGGAGGNAPNSGNDTPKSNAQRIGMKGLNWTLVFIYLLHLADVCLQLLH